VSAPVPTETFARKALLQLEGIANRIFGNDLNPFYYLGALGFYFFWVVALSGAYIYAFYKTGIELSYPSVEYLTHEQWYFGGVMRSLHRYASDALIIVMVLHLLREYILGRYRGARWFAWVTGVPLMWLMFSAGINGYWMVWDKLAQYSVVATMAWFDWLPLFSEPVSQSFISQEVLNDRFFSLISFAHVTVPLIILCGLWIHIMRISNPVVNPKRALALGMFISLLILALIKPVVSQGLADMAIEPTNLKIDWFYLYIYPLLDVWTAGEVWILVIGISVLLCLLPWLPARYKQIPVAEVNLKECSGCRLCVADCPYEAVVMRQRSDGMSFLEEAVVVADRCVSCGICVGSCPSSNAFRNEAGYLSGIEMPSLLISDLRSTMNDELQRIKGASRIIVFGCDKAANVEKLRSDSVAVLSFPCIAMLPASFIEYALHEQRVDGVLITGCRDDDCFHRLGVQWTEQRLTAKREPRLRSRAERERIRKCWASSADMAALASALESFHGSLRNLPKHEKTFN